LFNQFLAHIISGRGNNTLAYFFQFSIFYIFQMQTSVIRISLDKGGFETRDKREGMTEVAFFHRDIVTFAGGTSACGTLDGEGGSGQSHKDTND
jgi:hypothetical protein